MGKRSDKICRESQHIFSDKKKLFFENHAVYEIMEKNTVEPDMPQKTIRRMRFLCWIITATNTDSEYVILTAFPLQQWFHARASVLCLTFCFVNT
jgi:hypothetical protein